MTAFRFLPLTLVPCLLCVFAAAEETDPAAAFKAAQPKIAQDLRNRHSDVRIAAVQILADHPVVDSAKLLIPLLASSDGPLRRAAFESLAKISNDRSVANHLLEQLAKHWRTSKRNGEGFGIMAILLGSETADDRQVAAELLESAASRSAQGRMSAIDLIDQLGTGGGETACRALVELSTSTRAATDFAFQRAIAQALIRLEVKPAVAALVKLMGSVKGEVRGDIVRYLEHISKKQHGGDPDAWNTWWTEQQTTFEFPPAVTRLALSSVGRPQAEADAKTPSYYGLPLTASKIVFVIDVSGSMQGPRIIAAKRDLVRAVESLPANVTFTIIGFHTRAIIWQRKLVPASEEYKRNAGYFVAALELGSKTASYDALEAALELDAEAMYFLTDGAPTAGKITSPPQIVSAVTRQNRYRRMTLNCLGIGVDSLSFEKFLADLAQENFGVFERVDQ